MMNNSALTFENDRLVEYFCIVGTSNELTSEVPIGGATGKAHPARNITATLLDRYPPFDREDGALPHGISSMAFPMGMRLRRAQPSAQPLPDFFTFVACDAIGTKTYGSCLICYEPATPSQLACLDDDLAQALTSDGSCFFVPRCLCVLSRWYFPFFRTWLTELYRISLSSSLPIERHVQYLCDHTPLPPAGRLDVMVAIGGSEVRLQRPPRNDRISPINLPIRDVFECLDVGKLVTAWHCLILERSLLLVSSQLSILTAAAEVLVSLMYPLAWQCPYIPVLPKACSDFLHMPTSYLIGVDAGLYSTLSRQGDIPSHAVVVHLDRNSVVVPEEEASQLPALPGKARSKLVAALMERCDAYSRRGQNFNTDRLPFLDQAFSFSKRPQDDSDGGDDEVGDGDGERLTSRRSWEGGDDDDGDRVQHLPGHSRSRSTSRAASSSASSLAAAASRGLSSLMGGSSSAAADTHSDRQHQLQQPPDNEDYFGSVLSLLSPSKRSHTSTATNNISRRPFSGRAARAAFFRFMISMVGRYRDHIVQPATREQGGQPVQVHADGDQQQRMPPRSPVSTQPRFDRDGFVASPHHPSDARPFLTALTMTQGWSEFIETRLDPPQPDIDGMFVDESIDAKANRSKLLVKKRDTPFLDSKAEAISKTVVAPIPDASNLPSGYEPGHAFVYERFPCPLDQHLFVDATSAASVPHLSFPDNDLQLLGDRRRPPLADRSRSESAGTASLSALVAMALARGKAAGRGEGGATAAGSPTAMPGMSSITYSGGGYGVDADDLITGPALGEGASGSARGITTTTTRGRAGVSTAGAGPASLSYTAWFLAFVAHLEVAAVAVGRKVARQVDEAAADERAQALADGAGAGLVDWRYDPQHIRRRDQAVSAAQSAYLTHCLAVAFAVLRRMKGEGVIPSELVYISILEACGRSGDYARGYAVLKDMARQGYRPDGRLYSLIFSAFVYRKPGAEAAASGRLGDGSANQQQINDAIAGGVSASTSSTHPSWRRSAGGGKGGPRPGSVRAAAPGAASWKAGGTNSIIGGGSNGHTGASAAVADVVDATAGIKAASSIYSSSAGKANLSHNSGIATRRRRLIGSEQGVAKDGPEGGLSSPPPSSSAKSSATAPLSAPAGRGPPDVVSPGRARGQHPQLAVGADGGHRGVSLPPRPSTTSAPRSEPRPAELVPAVSPLTVAAQYVPPQAAMPSRRGGSAPASASSSSSSSISVSLALAAARLGEVFGRRGRLAPSAIMAKRPGAKPPRAGSAAASVSTPSPPLPPGLHQTASGSATSSTSLHNDVGFPVNARSAPDDVVPAATGVTSALVLASSAAAAAPPAARVSSSRRMLTTIGEWADAGASMAVAMLDRATQPSTDDPMDGYRGAVLGLGMGASEVPGIGIGDMEWHGAAGVGSQSDDTAPAGKSTGVANGSAAVGGPSAHADACLKADERISAAGISPPIAAATAADHFTGVVDTADDAAVDDDVEESEQAGSALPFRSPRRQALTTPAGEDEWSSSLAYAPPVSPRGSALGGGYPYGGHDLAYRFPGLAVDTGRETCPACGARVTAADVVAGWAAGDNQHDYTTTCPRCVGSGPVSGAGSRSGRFVARFAVSASPSSAADLLPPPAPGSPLSTSAPLVRDGTLLIEWLPPAVLVKELQACITKGCFSDHLHWSAVAVFWNLVVLCGDRRLPADFLTWLCSAPPLHTAISATAVASVSRSGSR